MAASPMESKPLAIASDEAAISSIRQGMHKRAALLLTAHNDASHGEVRRLKENFLRNEHDPGHVPQAVHLVIS